MPQLRFLFSLLLVVLIQACVNMQSRFALQTGDLLFSVGKENSELVAAIQTSTGQDKDIPFSHVGIVSIENGRVYVLEATHRGVIKG